MRLRLIVFIKIMFLVAVTALVTFFLTKSKSLTTSTTNSTIIPTEIKKSANFPIYVPGGDITPFQIDPTTVKLMQDPTNPELKVVSFVITAPQNKVTISEQVTPGLISEQLGLDKLASTMQAYQEIVTSFGRVELTRPKELNGGQTAVAAPNFTTLIMARPDKDLTDNEWRTIFNAMEIIK